MNAPLSSSTRASSRRGSLLRRVGAVAAASALALGMSATAVSTAAAASAEVVGAGVNVRAGAGTGHAIVGSLAPGAITIECQTRGENVAGVYNSDWWAKVSVNGTTGYASRAYIRVPVGEDVPTCSNDGGGGSVVNGPISRAEIIDRAMFWANQRLPYNWDASAPDAQGRHYRLDCSGMVANAFHLDWSPNTETLINYVHPISKSELRPGDIIGNLGPGTGGAAGHVVVFNGWTDASQTSFYSIEQRGDGGAGTWVRDWGTSYWNQKAFRYNNVSD
ncbi:SH3 domain-containing protein [Parenemella sanctibonifatiensis]|uniref:NlpC/P60 domain-containing protein n=1 Tax=Parenemella sanctibonifatiensis TaxID=2016505 RepID=A0A255EJQ0_9ACTN|nr:SH3 domain-containing protein [Parenemella sanctibonifatiensis]OYN91201.1 hypothetical protein CGZ91_07030 [Parenemella sanctibonifatiensis]